MSRWSSSSSWRRSPPAVGPSPDPRRRVGGAVVRHPRRAVADPQDRPGSGREPERGQVPHRPAPGDAVLPVPLRRDVPPAEPRRPRPGDRRHGRHRGLHLLPAVPAGTGVPGATALPGLSDLVPGGLRLPLQLRGRVAVPGGPRRAPHRRHADAPPGRRRGRARDPGGGGRARTAGRRPSIWSPRR